MEEDTRNKNEEIEQTEEKKQDPAQDPGQRLFTQEEVNKIVAARLERERNKYSDPAPIVTDEDLTARASLLDCKEYVLNNGLSTDLLDILDTTDVAAFKAKAEKLHTMSSRPPLYPYVKDGGEPVKQDFESEAIKKAFAGAAHTPKKY